MARILILLSVALFFCAAIVAAEVDVKVSAQVRVRNAVNRVQFEKGSSFYYPNVLRVRGALSAIVDSSITAYVEFQDSRDFFTDDSGRANSGTTDNRPNVDLHQGYVRIPRIFLRGLSIQLGRFEFSHGSERLFGPDDWDNVGRSFQGATLTYGRPDSYIRAFGLAGESVDLNVWRQRSSVIWGIAGRTAALGLEPIFYYENIDVDESHYIVPFDRYTAGIYWQDTFGQIGFESNVAYQFGERETIYVSPQSHGWEEDIAAWLLAGEVDWKVSWLRDLNWSLGFDISSGEGYGDRTIAFFEAPYRSIHRFHGRMLFLEYPLGQSSRVKEAGLRDLYMTFSYPASQLENLGIQLHHLASQRAFYQSGERGEKLGWQFDLIVTSARFKPIAAEFGGSIFFPSRFFAQTTERQPGLWLYSMLTAAF